MTQVRVSVFDNAYSTTYLIEGGTPEQVEASIESLLGRYSPIGYGTQVKKKGRTPNGFMAEVWRSNSCDYSDVMILPGANMTDPNPTLDPRKYIITQHVFAASEQELDAMLNHLAMEAGQAVAAQFDVTREVLPDGRHVAHITPKTT